MECDGRARPFDKTVGLHRRLLSMSMAWPPGVGTMENRTLLTEVYPSIFGQQVRELFFEIKICGKTGGDWIQCRHDVC